MFQKLLTITILATCFVLRLPAPLFAAEDFFREHIAPLLERRCLSCHNDTQRKGDFSLQTAAAARAGGHIEAGDAGASYLIAMVTPEAGKAEMPKDADPLSGEEIAVLRRWIDAGAEWPSGVELSAARVADLDWWSLRPLARPGVPDRISLSADHANVRTPIDAFIYARLEQQGLTPSPEADRRTLIRRLSFDLLGLPPTPEEIQAFVSDPDPKAYEHLVDRMLASEHYGERWARHWLDVAHYADTHGYDKDKLRPNAWPYRDYVIRSLNADKPYSQFVAEQIAGDVLWPHTRDGITATGFIAAGPWDFIGHAEVPESKIDGRIARNLDRDDMVASTMNTFCSTTVQCARCHNHKFDPITQEHYYSLQAVFAALDRADREYDDDPHVAERRAELNERLERLGREKQILNQAAEQAAGEALVKTDAALQALQSAAREAQPEFGYHSQIEAGPNLLKWCQVDLGAPTRIAEIVYVACHDTFNEIGHGFGFPVRYRIEASNDADFGSGVTVVVDHTQDDVSNPGTTPQRGKPAGGLEARYVRVTATRLALRKDDYIFALAELMVMTPDGDGLRNAALGKPITALDSIEAPVRWQRKNLVDGYYYGVGPSPAQQQEIARLEAERQGLLEAALTADARERLAAVNEELKIATVALEELPPEQKVYAGMVYDGTPKSQNFVGTGHQGGKPRMIHVLNRGDILQPLEKVGPGTLPVIEGSNWRFDLPATHSEGDRRVALARWLVRLDNPLTWRSIVNRVWQYHFGRGLVDSPNDFGRMGGTPSHPGLLDWLAVEFRDNGQSLKQLHKLIVTSSVYRQVSSHHLENSELDGGNVYLWRMNRRRLTAEEIRDSVLSVSGKLDGAMFGPGVQLFVLEHPEHSPHYEYHKHDPDDPASHRRSIYRFVVRSQPDPFMTTLDCADSSQSTPKRDETVTALQALSLLNNRFMLRMSEHFAARVRAETNDPGEQVERAFRLAVGRSPTEAQLRDLKAYTLEVGLENTCRLLFNLNEFVFVD